MKTYRCWYQTMAQESLEESLNRETSPGADSIGATRHAAPLGCFISSVVFLGWRVGVPQTLHSWQEEWLNTVLQCKETTRRYTNGWQCHRRSHASHFFFFFAPFHIEDCLCLGWEKSFNPKKRYLAECKQLLSVSQGFWNSENCQISVLISWSLPSRKDTLQENGLIQVIRRKSRECKAGGRFWRLRAFAGKPLSQAGLIWTL